MFRLRPLPAARYKILPKAAYFIGSVLTFYLLSSQAGAQTGGGTITLRS
ncbi:MAG: hypothetical protein F6K04_14245, partial [Leptolyngbya sp. SIO4C5]|nr:hypothetical protein [Leptolyngbya sp. SIO4C5]